MLLLLIIEHIASWVMGVQWKAYLTKPCLWLHIGNSTSLTLIYDDNHNTIDGATSLAFLEDICKRFEALGWNTITVNDLDTNMGSFRNALLSAYNETEKPTFIRVKTSIGKLSRKEGTS